MTQLAVTATDQRRDPRHITVLIIGKVCGPRGEYACVVHDVSTSGLKARFPHPPVVGERLTLAFRGVPPIAATVRWADGNQGGVEFDRPLDLRAILVNYGSARLPRSPRFACRHPINLIIDGHDCHADLIDVSLGGAKLGIGPVGMNVVGRGGMLILPVLNTPRAGAIRWDDGERIGFQFATPLTIDVLAGILANQAVDGRSAAGGLATT